MADAKIFERYLSILGIEAAPPGLDHLHRLVRAQLTRVPFENISKLFLKKTQGASYIPSLEQHLDGIERFSFGGTCYANNPYFYELMRFLGYKVMLCGADMGRPDVHVVSMVDIEGRQFLVDVGYGAPFYEPMARDLDHPQEIWFGSNRFVLEPRDAVGRSRMTMLREGLPTHGYTAKPASRSIDDFDEVIRGSYEKSATFMNVLVVERFFSARSVRIHNFTLTESTPEGATTTRLADREELVDAIEHHVGIPADIVHEAVEGIALEADIYS